MCGIVGVVGQVPVNQTLYDALLLLLLAALVQLASLRDEAWWRQSLSARWLEPALAQLQPFLPELFGKYLSA